jgi:hypothetical protein
MIDIDDPDALPGLRLFIVSVGLDPSGLTDAEVRARVRALLEERVPAPAVGFGDQPINGREWFAAALTAGGFRQPEDRDRRAVVDAGEPDASMFVKSRYLRVLAVWLGVAGRGGVRCSA